MRILALAALAATITAAPAFAQYHQPQQSYSPWSFGGSVGTDAYTRGELHNAGVSNSVNLGGALGTGVIRIRARDFGDVYKDNIRATVEVRYALTRMSEAFGAISYNSADGGTTDIGCFEAAAGTACNAVVTGQFSDLVQYGAELGYRQWLGIGLLDDTIKPYFAVRVGAIRTDEISLRAAAGATSIGNLRLTEETWSAMLGADLGASFAISENVELGAEVGVRYTEVLQPEDADLDPLGLGEINYTDNVLSVPVSVRMNVVF
jgi:opacity protein-like surface antigen